MNDIKRKLEIGEKLLSALRIVCQECEGEGDINLLDGMEEEKRDCPCCDGGYISLESDAGQITLADSLGILSDNWQSDLTEFYKSCQQCKSSTGLTVHNEKRCCKECGFPYENSFDVALSLIRYFLQDWRDYANRMFPSIRWLNNFDYERTGSFGRMKESGIARCRTITTFGRWLEIDSDVLDEITRELDEIGLDLRMCLEMHVDKSELREAA